MRSVARGSFARLSSVEALWRACKRTGSGKRRQPALATFLRDADQEVLALHRALRSGRYRHGGYRLHVIRDPKVRLIAAAAVRDRVLHQALIHELAPTYERGFLPQHYACCTGRGPLRAALRYLSWSREFRFRLSLDIHRYFPSIVHRLLLALFARRLRDRDTLALLEHLLLVGGQVYQSPLAIAALGLAAEPVPPGCGLPIGSYVSQWSGALYLDGLDHFVKRTLKIPGFLRYMDDFTLFSDDAALLERARAAIAGWLAQERGLRLNERRWAVQPTGDPSVFLGFRVDQRTGIAPGPKMRRSFKRKVRAAGRGDPQRLLRTLRSYRGLFLL